MNWGADWLRDQNVWLFQEISSAALIHRLFSWTASSSRKLQDPSPQIQVSCFHGSCPKLSILITSTYCLVWRFQRRLPLSIMRFSHFFRSPKFYKQILQCNYSLLLFPWHYTLWRWKYYAFRNHQYKQQESPASGTSLSLLPLHVFIFRNQSCTPELHRQRKYTDP